ncbi:hypothetical protein MTR67_051401, partial [Solanum verrucosum]
MCSKTSPLMSWHHDKRVDDGVMRHPADSMAWKKFDELHPSFVAEPRNVAGLYKHDDSKRMEDFLSLSRGPMPYVTRFKGETGEEQNHMDYYGELTEVDMNPSKTLKYKMGQASKIPKHELIQPGALAKGLGQSLKSMSTIRVNAERRTPIAKNRSYYTTTSKLNKLADNSFHVHPCFEEKEDNAPLHQEAKMNQYNLTSDARGQEQSLRINAEKRTMIGENRNTTTTSSRNKPAKKSIPVPPDFNP